MKSALHIFLASLLILAHLASVAPKSLLRDTFWTAGILDDEEKATAEDADAEKNQEKQESEESGEKEGKEGPEFEKEFILPSKSQLLWAANARFWAGSLDGKEMMVFSEISIPPPEC